MKKIILAFLIAFTLQISVLAVTSEVKIENQTTVINSNIPTPIDKLTGHFKNKVKVVFSDIDGTLLPTGKNAIKGEVPLSVMIAADNLKQAKIPVVLATGRSYWEAKQIATKMGNEDAYIIAQQGAEIVNPSGQIIYQDGIDSKTFIKILKNIDSLKKANHLDSKVFFVADSKPYATEEFELPYIWENRTVIKNYKELKNKSAFTKISICEKNPEKLKLIQKHLKKKFPEYQIDIAADCYVDITSATATKGNAIEKLSKMLGYNLKNAAVIGDAENDITMLKLVKTNGGLAIAVGNAMDSVKRNANFVTSSVYDGGFSKAVDEVLNNNDILDKKKTKLVN